VKILDSLKAKLILPVAGLILLSGCYTFVGKYSPSQKRPAYIYLHDSDGDGIPDLYDPHPYFYDLPFLVKPYPYYHPYFHQGRSFYSPPPKVKIETKKYPVKERKDNIQRLRDNSGDRNPSEKRR
jgi:hypothetical protein